MDEAGDVAPLPPLTEDVAADVVIVGGGYTGLWTAWHLPPEARVVLLEGAACGHGPSGRNGGFTENLWLSFPALQARFGEEGALAVARAGDASVSAIGAWCEEQGVDAWFRRGGQMVVSTAEAFDGVGAQAAKAAAAFGGGPDGPPVVSLGAAEVRARCASPTFRAGVLMPGAATVQPARLALGLRQRLLDRGVRIHEHSRVRRVTAGGEVHTDGGRVRARHVVLAAGAALAGFPPLRGRLTVASSHIVLTEPVPDILDELGWTGGECITDARQLLHYFRTTRDGRIAYGWAGGRLAMGGRTTGRVEVDADVVARATTDLLRTFPQLAGRRITHGWGGPIDVAPGRMLTLGSVGDRVHHAFGYTGNGVGPSHLAGRILASLALDRRDDLTRLPLVGGDDGRVPPDPWRWLGGTAVLAAIHRRETAQERGERPGRLAAAVAALPRRLGITVGR